MFPRSSLVAAPIVRPAADVLLKKNKGGIEYGKLNVNCYWFCTLQ